MSKGLNRSLFVRSIIFVSVFDGPNFTLWRVQKSDNSKGYMSVHLASRQKWCLHPDPCQLVSHLGDGDVLHCPGEDDLRKKLDHHHAAEPLFSCACFRHQPMHVLDLDRFEVRFWGLTSQRSTDEQVEKRSSKSSPSVVATVQRHYEWHGAVSEEDSHVPSFVPWIASATRPGCLSPPLHATQSRRAHGLAGTQNISASCMLREWCNSCCHDASRIRLYGGLHIRLVTVGVLDPAPT